MIHFFDTHFSFYYSLFLLMKGRNLHTKHSKASVIKAHSVVHTWRKMGGEMRDYINFVKIGLDAETFAAVCKDAPLGF